MNAPAHGPHAKPANLPVWDRAAVLDEIGRLFWAIQCHAGTGQSFAETETADGIELAFKHIRACLVQLAKLKKGLAHDEP